jgi:hypothetical protein
VNFNTVYSKAMSYNHYVENLGEYASLHHLHYRKFSIEADLISQIRDFKPIKIFGYFFIAISILFCIVLLFEPATGPNEPHMLIWGFVIFSALFHFLLGIGILLKKNWGFVFFKAYLKLLFLAFPIGTYISKKTFEYMDEYNTKKYFN